MDDVINTIITAAATAATLVLALVSYVALKQSYGLSRRLLEIEELKSIPKLIITDGTANVSEGGQCSFDLKNVGGETAFIRSIFIRIDPCQMGELSIKQHEMPPGTISHNEFSADPQEEYTSITITVKYAVKQDKDCAAYIETFALSPKEKNSAGTTVFKLDK